ncbi:MAG: archease [Candidatus Aenigmatarchaeota archaeon]
MKKYEIVEDLTSDVMFEAYGKNLRELFENAALAMASVICRTDLVKAKKKLNVEISAENEEKLLVSWLQHLIALVDTEEMFFSRFEVLKIDARHLKARVYGEPIEPGKGGTVVKAVTYYRLGVEKTASGWKARVALDV